MYICRCAEITKMIAHRENLVQVVNLLLDAAVETVKVGA